MAEFKNPNQQGAPQDNRTLFIVMLVMLLGLTAFNFYRTKHNPQTASPQASAQTANTAQQQPAVTGTGLSQGSAGQAVQIPAVVPVVAASERTTVVENELYKITFSNKGGQAISWVLKKYTDSYKQPLDLIHTQAAEQYGYPLSLYTYDAGRDASLAKALYQPSATGNLSAPASLTFKLVQGGYSVTKTFTFDSSYEIHADVQVLHDGAPVRALVSWPGGLGDQEDAISYSSAQVDYSAGGHEKHEAFKNVHGGNTLNGPLSWAGTSDLYFASIFLPDNPETATLATFHDELIVAKADRKNGLGQGVAQKPHANPDKNEMKVPVLGSAMGSTDGHTQTRLFAGPKAVEVLRNVHPANEPTENLAPLLDFGYLAIVGKPLFYSLRFIHEHITSGAMGWGWAIVLLTIAINILILPLRIKTMIAGLKMQRIQPQIQAIKDKWKNPSMKDQEKFNAMNAEVMAYQKEKGVNMFGGCLPTLIQMPLLFAFFGMLPKVVELRHAHWFWLPDLSSADPWHILPILMVVSQFLVQWYTPSPGVDPQQQKTMALMMPVFSGYMTWSYASGLALYWSVGNLISIATQMVMNQTPLGKEARALAAKRSRRKAGLGVGSAGNKPRTIQGKPVRR